MSTEPDRTQRVLIIGSDDRRFGIGPAERVLCVVRRLLDNEAKLNHPLDPWDDPKRWLHGILQPAPRPEIVYPVWPILGAIKKKPKVRGVPEGLNDFLKKRGGR